MTDTIVQSEQHREQKIENFSYFFVHLDVSARRHNLPHIAARRQFVKRGKLKMCLGVVLTASLPSCPTTEISLR